MRLGDTKETAIVVDVVKRKNRQDFSCQRCGRNHGPRCDYPARDTTTTCRRCGRKGQFAVVCFQKPISLQEE